MAFRSHNLEHKDSNANKNHKNSQRLASIARGFLARKKFKIIPLKQLVDYRAFIIPNDPYTYSYKHPHHELSNPTILFGTSCLGSVIIACELSNSTHRTKLMLIDNSRQVHAFWQLLQKLIVKLHPDFFDKNYQKTQTQCELKKDSKQVFFDELNQLSQTSKEKLFCLANDNCPRSINTIRNFFSKLFSKYGYERVVKIIAHTALIRQDWTSKTTIHTLRNIIDELEKNSKLPFNLYTYTSNILSYEGSTIDLRKNLLANNLHLKPIRSIFTDCGPCGPEHIFLIDHQNPKEIEEQVYFEPNQLRKKPLIKFALTIAAALLLRQFSLSPTNICFFLALVIHLDRIVFPRKQPGARTMCENRFFSLTFEPDAPATHTQIQTQFHNSRITV